MSDSEKKTIGQVVTERIKNISEPVFDRVVDTIVEKEATKRTDAIVKVMGKLEELQKEYRRQKPDIAAGLNEEGEEVSPAQWTKETLNKRKKLKENIGKHENAIEKALNGEMDVVYKLAGGGNNN